MLADGPGAGRRKVGAGGWSWSWQEKGRCIPEGTWGDWGRLGGLERRGRSRGQACLEQMGCPECSEGPRVPEKEPGTPLDSRGTLR